MATKRKNRTATKKLTIEAINNPTHYGGKKNPVEVIKVIRGHELGFSTGNAVKYILRAGKKDSAKTIEDLEKAKWYLQEEIDFQKSLKRKK